MSVENQLKKQLGSAGYSKFKQVANQAVELRQLQGAISYKEMAMMKLRISEASKVKVLVGIPADYASRGQQEGINNAELLYIHTNGVAKRKARQEIEKQIKSGFSGPYGTVREKVFQMFMLEHGSPAYSVPPRPVIEPALMSIKQPISKKLGDALLKFIAGDDKGSKIALKELGIMCQSECQKWFENPKNNWPPLAQSTIEAKRKKHNKPDYDPIPLVDTGALRQSITYVIDYPRTKLITGKKQDLWEDDEE